MTTDPHWAVIWAKSARNPRLFVTDLLKATPEDWQREALEKIAQHDRLSIRAGHGVGKTTFIAWVVLWFMLTRMPYKVPITANSQDQLRDVVWPELRKWRDRLPEPLRNQIVIEAERIWLKGLPESFAVARTASKDNPEALQGFHDENLLFVIEEASGIDDVVFEVAQGAMSTPGAKILMCGNPTRTSGYFYDTHHSLRSRWETMRVNSEDVPRARGHIEDVIAKYGKESNVYRVRVLGEFPDSEDDVVVPLHLCEAAIGRKVEPPDLIRPVWGLDVARFGSDRTALAKRRGNVQLEPIKSWRGKDTMQTAGLIAKEYEDADKLDRPSEILVDVIGIGAGVVDRLNELGLPVRGVNVAESAAVSERFMRLRDELWFKAREWLEAKDSKLCDDQALVGELTCVKYEITSGGKIKVEGKDDLKKRGMQSPDLADSWNLTFAGGLDRRDAEEIDRYRRPQRRAVSAWAV
jgi:phage terminase large subunit